MIAYRDFVPATEKGKWYKGETYASFDSAVEAANQWLDSAGVTAVSIETVVLPNIDAPSEEGTSDAKLDTVSGWASWHQFLRVWFRQA